MDRRIRRARRLPMAFLDLHLPPALKREELDAILPMLRSGDAAIIDHTIRGCLRLAMAISNSYAFSNPNRAMDLFGVACVALVEAVNRIASGQALTEHDNIGGYLNVYISGKVKTFKITDHMVRIPRNPAMLALIKEKGPEALLATFGTIPYNECDPEDRDEFADNDNYRMYLEYAQAPDHGYDLSLSDFATFARINERDLKILQLRISGESFEEIGSQLGVTKQAISLRILKMKRELSKYLKAEAERTQ